MLFKQYDKICPSCGNDFEAKRTNQTYCSSKCKARFNNYKAKQQRSVEEVKQQITAKHGAILWHNRCLLKKYKGENVKVETLKAIGFKFSYITFFKLDKTTKRNVFSIYDIKYVFKSEDVIEVLN